MIEIPNFTVESELGRGGMATVYLAVQDMLSRKVALKVMLPDMARDENFRKSFLSEGKIIANLEHPNIVRIHDFGIIDDSILYMAMEHLSGGTLKEKVANGKLPFEAALKIIEDTSAGLSYAHAKGYIHRDIKPGNILFREDETAVITDFGIAKLQDTSGELTRMGYTMGTVQYMSPEQAVTTDLDHRSDIYSLGLVFYEMLTGQKAFKAESTIQAIHQHTTVAPPELPPEYSFLQATIDKVLAKEPADRFQNINDFVSSIKNSRGIDETVIHRIPPVMDDDSTQILRTGHYQVQQEPKRKKGMYAGIASAFVLFVGLAFGITKYPEIKSWLNKEEALMLQQENLANQTKAIEEKKSVLFEQEKLEKEREVENKRQDKIKQEELQKLAAIQKARSEADAEEKRKSLDLQKQRETSEALSSKQKLETEKKEKLLAEQNKREEKLAMQIAEAKKQAIKAEQIKFEAEQKAREKVLADKIALLEKQAADIEKERFESEKKEALAKKIILEKKQAEATEQRELESARKERDRILAEQIANAKKQADEAKSKTEQERLARLEEDRNQREKIIAEQDKFKAQLEKEQLELALAEKNKLAEEQLRQKELKAEQERLNAEALVLQKQKAEKLEKNRLAEQKRKGEINKEKKRKEDLAKKKARDAKKKALASKKENEAKRRKAALIAKKKADAIKRQQQIANSKGQIRASATLNGRPLNTTFIVTKNGKRVKMVGGRSSVNFVLPAGRYVLSTQFSGKSSHANVHLEPNDIVSQSFAFRGSAPAKQPKVAPKDWTHEHKAPKS